MDEIESLGDFERFTAVFAPRRVDDLRPGGAALIGRRLHWSKGWIIEDGPYAGQWACALLEPGSDAWSAPFAWVPACDLVEVRRPGDGLGTEQARDSTASSVHLGFPEER